MEQHSLALVASDYVLEYVVYSDSNYSLFLCSLHNISNQFVIYYIQY